MVAGLAAGLLVFPGIGLASAFLLSTMLCSTDAARGQRVVDDTAVPAKVRQALDVESGLNDGLAVPFFLVALDISLSTLKGGVPSAVISNAASQIGWGIALRASAREFWEERSSGSPSNGVWVKDEWRQLFTLSVALSAYAAASGLGGSGFIAAFVGGMTFGRVSGEHGLRVAYVTEEAGNLLAAVTWIGFGALALGAALPHVTWRVVVYALLSLTVVRMLPVAIALTKSGARFQTMAFIGWFGPRGLASVVFALLALERSIPQSQTLLTTVVVTVCLSVVLHGLTSVPLVSAYHRWYAALSAVAHPGAAEATPTVVPRRRHHSGVGEKGFAGGTPD